MTGNMRALWLLFLAALGALLVLGWVYPYKGHFGLDKLPLFGAWFGIAVGAAIVVVARIVGAILKREDSYYG
ncbi:MAG: hypothetical protein AAGD23_11785 [Pseudomonadota bacterium]